MKRDEILERLKKSSVISIHETDTAPLYEAMLENGDILNIYIFEESMMFFMHVENLGDAGYDNPEMFVGLLSANNLGGRLFNQRVTYDPEDNDVSICHDVFFENVDNPDEVDEELKTFIENERLFASIIREKVLTPCMEKIE